MTYNQLSEKAKGIGYFCVGYGKDAEYFESYTKAREYAIARGRDTYTSVWTDEFGYWHETVYYC